MKLIKMLATVLTILSLSAAASMAQTQREASVMPTHAQYVLESLELDVTIDGQKARCTLKYVIFNPGNRDMEVDFLAPLPPNGTITGLTLFDGKKEMPGNVYNKNEAWNIYRDIVANLKDPALLEYAGRDTFRARIFPVPANGRQTLELTFDYLVSKNDGQAAFNFPLAGPVTLGQKPALNVHVVVKNANGVSGLYSPVPNASIKQEKGMDSVVTYQSSGQPVLDYFQLFFKLDAGPLGGLVLSHKPSQNEDGFFMFLAEPALNMTDNIEVSKNVVFVLDKSGSMSGPKFSQATEALRFILERLNEKDNFNLVDYNGDIYAWQPELAAMTPENRKAALAYVDNLRANGNTDIEGALKESFRMISDPTAPNYVIFLTDGQPTVGETNEMRLAEIAAKANPQNSARLFAFGVGYDVNARLLDRLSGQANGTSVFVAPDENLETKVASFFARLTTPALTGPSLKAGTNLNRVMPQVLPDFFTGQQVVVVGRYPKGGAATFTLTGRQGDKDQTYIYNVNLAEGPTQDGAFIASIWAQRRIGEIIDMLDLKGHNQELVDELVQLSKKYGILTPYTSFLALEDQAITADEKLQEIAAENVTIMDDTVGQSANKQREIKGGMKTVNSAPAPMSSKLDEMEAYAALDKQVASAGNFNKMHAPNNWAGQIFFYKNGQWQAENLKEKDLAKPVNIVQLSDEYFELAQQLSPDEMVWLTQKDPVLFNHNGVTYLIEPVKNM